MIDCSSEINSYYNDRVRLTEAQRKQLRDHRDANRRRLKDNLKKSDKPSPVGFVGQGSYTMRTTVQQPDNDYDIDDGVVFKKEDLKGPQGAEMSPLDVRKMVHEAAKDPKFNKEPEILKNCVRVHYVQGHHVDVPSYRQLADDSKELASSEWKASAPKAVTEWFTTENDKQSPDSSNGKQLRRSVCLAKGWARKNKSWNMPSGLVLSKLVVERFNASLDRDDESLYLTLKAIHTRLKSSLEVDHPVVSEKLTNGPDDARTRTLRDKLEPALEELRVLESGACTKAQALKAWKQFFGTDYFDKMIEAEEAKDQEKADAAISGLSISSPASPWCATA